MKAKKKRCCQLKISFSDIHIWKQMHGNFTGFHHIAQWGSIKMFCKINRAFLNGWSNRYSIWGGPRSILVYVIKMDPTNAIGAQNRVPLTYKMYKHVSFLYILGLVKASSNINMNIWMSLSTVELPPSLYMHNSALIELFHGHVMPYCWNNVSISSYSDCPISK